MNFLTISSQVLIELGANELIHNLATPLKEIGNSHSMIASSDTWDCLYESQIATKYNRCMWGSSLGCPLNCSTSSNFWNIIGFNSKLQSCLLEYMVSQCWAWNTPSVVEQSMSMICYCLALAHFEVKGSCGCLYSDLERLVHRVLFHKILIAKSLFSNFLIPKILLVKIMRHGFPSLSYDP